MKWKIHWKNTSIFIIFSIFFYFFSSSFISYPLPFDELYESICLCMNVSVRYDLAFSSLFFSYFMHTKYIIRMNMCGTLIILSILALMAVVPIITQYSVFCYFPFIYFMWSIWETTNRTPPSILFEIEHNKSTNIRKKKKWKYDSLSSIRLHLNTKWNVFWTWNNRRLWFYLLVKQNSIQQYCECKFIKKIF